MLLTGLGTRGGRRMTMSIVVDQCDDSHRWEVVSSCSFLAFFDTAATTHHSYMLTLPSGRGWMVNPAGWLLSRWLGCRRWCSSSPPQKSSPIFRYFSYIFLFRKKENTTNNFPKIIPMDCAPMIISSLAMEIYVTSVWLTSPSPLSTEVSTWWWCADHFRCHGSSSSALPFGNAVTNW